MEMKKFFRVVEDIALAVLASGIYSLAHGDDSKTNAYIIFWSIYVLILSIFIQED